MRNNKIIRKGIKKLLTQLNEKKKISISFGPLSTKEIVDLKLKTGLNLSGYHRILDNYSINHTLKNHGNNELELKRGQIGVTEKDFLLIPQIVKTENIIYGGLSNTKTDLIIYEKQIGSVYYYLEEVRKGKKQIILKSMRKRKPPKK